MKKMLWPAIGLALIIITLGATGCDTIVPTPSSGVQSTTNSQQNTGIWVSGVGEVTVTPDIAILEVGVEAQETTVADAQDEAHEAMEKVMMALTDSGVTDEDIQTRQFRISQRTRWDDETDEEIVVGYRVTNEVTAKIREIEKVSSIIDTVVKAGGNFIRIDDLDFSVDDPSDYYDEARETAMADARDKAEKLADAADVKLGAPTYISESSSFVSVPMVDMAFAGGIPVPAPAPIIETPPSISPGEVEVSVTVQIAYSIK